MKINLTVMINILRTPMLCIGTQMFNHNEDINRLKKHTLCMT